MELGFNIVHYLTLVLVRIIFVLAWGVNLVPKIQGTDQEKVLGVFRGNCGKFVQTFSVGVLAINSEDK